MKTDKYRYCWFCGKPFEMTVSPQNRRFCSIPHRVRQWLAIRRLATTSFEQKKDVA